MKWWRWPWSHSAKDTTEEAKAALEKLAGKDAEITRLSKELRRTKEQNSFSKMVNEAISRTAREQRRG